MFQVLNDSVSSDSDLSDSSEDRLAAGPEAEKKESKRISLTPEESSRILASLAARCGKADWAASWSDATETFQLLFLTYTVKDPKDRKRRVQEIPSIFTAVQYVDDREDADLFHKTWCFQVSAAGKVVTSWRAAKKLPDSVIAEAAVSCMVEELEKGRRSFAFFASESIVNIFLRTRPRVFLSAGTSLEQILLMADLEGK